VLQRAARTVDGNRSIVMIYIGRVRLNPPPPQKKKKKKPTTPAIAGSARKVPSTSKRMSQSEKVTRPGECGGEEFKDASLWRAADECWEAPAKEPRPDIPDPGRNVTSLPLLSTLETALLKGDSGRATSIIRASRITRRRTRTAYVHASAAHLKSGALACGYVPEYNPQ